MRKNILKHLQKMEFVCGLKQFKEYKEQDANELIECLNDLFKKFGWMSDERVDYILHAGMRGQYGDFYHVNEKTVNGWINQYYQHHQSQIVMEIQNLHNKDREQSPEQIAHWNEIGKQTFRDNYKHAKETGTCRHIAEWGVYWFNRFQEKGILKPWLFNVEEIEQDVRKELRITQKWVEESTVAAKSKNRIWKLFILESIKENKNLDQLI